LIFVIALILQTLVPYFKDVGFKIVFMLLGEWKIIKLHLLLEEEEDCNILSL